MKKNINFALVGCGGISSTHARAISLIPGARLAAVCDLIPARASALAAQFNAVPYTDIHAMLKNEPIDVVNVLTPSGLHAEIGMIAARAGKHVIVEKPIDVSLEKADELVKTCRVAGVKLSSILQHRFDNAVIELKRASQAGLLGQLNFGASQTKWYRAQEYYDSGDWRGTWELGGGGALMTQAIHYVDLLQYIMGPVAEVSAYTATRAHERIVVEDVAVAAVKFRSGAVGLIEGSTLAYPGYYARLDIYGSGGSIVIEDDNIKNWHLRSGEPHQADDEAIPSIAGTSSLNIWELSHRKQIEDVVDAVRKDRPPKVSGEDGRQALKIILAVYESARLGNPIQLADV